MGVATEQSLAEKAAEFINRYATYKDQDQLRERIQKHLEYKTCKIFLDEAAHVCAVCLWNISPDGLEAHVIDMVIREDYRKQDIMRAVLIEGLKIWPVKFLRWNRDYNEDGHDRWREPKVWSVERFLRRKT
jgi:hypothetical protein